MTVRFVNGIWGTIICSDNVTSPINFESSTGENPTIPYHEDVEGLYRVFGTHGTLSVPDFTLYHQKDGSQEKPSWLNPVLKEKLIQDKETELLSRMPFDLQLNHFIDVIRGNAEPLCTALDGVSSALCIDAVLKSIQTGLPQTVAEATSINPDFGSLGVKNALV